jgi:hypothetical protein
LTNTLAIADIAAAGGSRWHGAAPAAPAPFCTPAATIVAQHDGVAPSGDEYGALVMVPPPT